MATLSLADLITLLKQGNPQQIVTQIISTNYPNDPSMQRLLELGERGDINQLQQIAQQLLSQQGKDFNTEMQNLMAVIKQL